MGVINVAMDEEVGRQVAIKQIRPEMADHEPTVRSFSRRERLPATWNIQELFRSTAWVRMLTDALTMRCARQGRKPGQLHSKIP